MKPKISGWVWLLAFLPFLIHTLVSLASGNVVFSIDDINWQYTLRRWHALRVQAGSWPLWNDGLFGGIYQAGSAGIGVFSPSMILYYLIPNAYAAHFTMVLTGIWGGAGAAVLARGLTGSFVVAGFAAIAYLMGGSTLSLLHNASYFSGACWYPWVLWGHYRLKDAPNTRNTVLFAVLLSALSYEGDPIGMVAIGFFCLIDWIFGDGRSRKGLGCFGSALLLTGFLCAVIWLPGWEAMSQSARQAKFAWDETVYFSLAPAQLLHWIVPGFFGYFYEGTFWGLQYSNSLGGQRFWADSIYSGIPVLVLAGVALAAEPRGRTIRVWALLGFGVLLVALGKHLPVHQFLYERLPLYGKLRFPERYYVFVHLFMVLLAARGAAHFFSRQKKDSRTIPLVLGAMAALYTLGFAIVVCFKPQSHTLAALLPPDKIESLFEWLDFQKTKSLVLALLCVAALVFRRRKEVALLLASPALLALLALDLLASAPPFFTKPFSTIEESSGLAAVLVSQDAYPARFVRDALLDRTSSAAGRETLKNNWAVVEGLQDTLGYDPTAPSQIYSLLGNTLFAELPTWSRVLGFNYVLTPMHPRVTDLEKWHKKSFLEVKALFEDRNLAVLKMAQWVPRFEWFSSVQQVTDFQAALEAVRHRGSDKEPAIVETDQVLWQGKYAANKIPIFESAAATRAPLVEVVHVSPERLVYDVTALSPGLFVVRETFFPSWRVRSNGEELPLIRTDAFSRGVWVPQGKNRVELFFQPASFYTGAAVSGVAWLAVGVFVLSQLRRKRRKKRLT